MFSSDITNGLFSFIKQIPEKFFFRQIPQEGCVGRSFYADNVRILFVNGILTTASECEANARVISKIFSNTRVDYAYIPTSIADTMESVIFSRPVAGSSYLLSSIQRNLESLKNRPDPTLIIMAHSGGAATLHAITQALSEREKNMIHVITFGAAYIFSDTDGFKAVTNIVAERDIVPRVSSFATGRFFAPFQQRNLVTLPAETSAQLVKSHIISGPEYIRGIEAIKKAYDHALSTNSATREAIIVAPEEESGYMHIAFKIFSMVTTIFDYIRGRIGNTLFENQAQRFLRIMQGRRD